MIGKVQFLIREAGNLFAITLEGLRKTWDVKHWWQEYLPPMLDVPGLA